MADDDLNDAARRAYDDIMLHVLALKDDAVGKWVAINLSDGRTDRNLYDTREDAIRHKTDYHCYICIPPAVALSEVATFLRFSRAIFSAGMRVPDMSRHHIMPMRLEDIPGGY